MDLFLVYLKLRVKGTQFVLSLIILAKWLILFPILRAMMLHILLIYFFRKIV